jgi:hypothetical protein
MARRADDAKFGYAAFIVWPGWPIFFWVTVMRFILGVFFGAALMFVSGYLLDTGVVKAGP